MPFLRPTLTQLRDTALQFIAAQQIYDVDTREVVAPVLLQFDPLTILAKAMAGLAYEEYGYLDWISLQSTPATATGEALLAWGALVNLALKPATAAQGSAVFSGQPGASLPVGSLLSRADGLTYVTTVDATLNADGTALVAFEAVDAGQAGTLSTGTTLTPSNSLPGVLAGVVAPKSTAGADVEELDAFRARVLARFAAPPHGGSASDFREWALAVPGVTRAWVSAGMGPGTVTVFVMFDDAESASGGFPQGSSGVSPLDNNGRPRDRLLASGDQRTVADALLPLQPVTALVYVAGPTPAPVNFTINDLGAADTPATRAAIADALSALFLSTGDPRGTVLYPSAWNRAIGAVSGLAQFTVAEPAAPVTLAPGRLPVLGTLATAA